MLNSKCCSGLPLFPSHLGHQRGVTCLEESPAGFCQLWTAADGLKSSSYFLSSSSSPVLVPPQLLPALVTPYFKIRAAFLYFRSLHGVKSLHLPFQFGSKQEGVRFLCLCSSSQCKTWEHCDDSEELLEEVCGAGRHTDLPRGSMPSISGHSVCCTDFQQVFFCVCVNWELPLPQAWTIF